MTNGPRVHFQGDASHVRVRRPGIPDAACGRESANALHLVIDPARVTCKACLSRMRFIGPEDHPLVLKAAQLGVVLEPWQARFARTVGYGTLELASTRKGPVWRVVS